MNLHGTVAELRFIEWLLGRGCDVFIPFHTTDCGADVAWRNLGKGEHHLVSAQVKKTYLKNEQTTVNITRSDDRRYHVSDADFLAAVDYEHAQLWLIPFHRVVDVTRLALGKKWKAYRHGL